jgi:hypothetical protein
MLYTMRVEVIDGGGEQDLPADTVTRDEPSRGGGPLVPLAYRPLCCPFYVCSERWPELAGKALRVKATARPRGRARPHAPEPVAER